MAFGRTLERLGLKEGKVMIPVSSIWRWWKRRRNRKRFMKTIKESKE